MDWFQYFVIDNDNDDQILLSSSLIYCVCVYIQYNGHVHCWILSKYKRHTHIHTHTHGMSFLFSIFSFHWICSHKTKLVWMKKERRKKICSGFFYSTQIHLFSSLPLYACVCVWSPFKLLYFNTRNYFIISMNRWTNEWMFFSHRLDWHLMM